MKEQELTVAKKRHQVPKTSALEKTTRIKPMLNFLSSFGSSLVHSPSIGGKLSKLVGAN